LNRGKRSFKSRHTVASFEDGGRLAVQVAADLARTIQDLEEVAKARATARSEGGTPLLTDVTAVITDALSQGIPEASLFSAIRSSVSTLLRAFAGKTLGEITPGAIETFKSIRLHSVTKRKTKRSPASVRHEIDLLSRIFSLAVTWGLAESNPCSRVTKIKLQNQRYRYLLPDDEPRLLAQCTGKRKHLATMIPFALGTGHVRASNSLSRCDSVISSAT